MNSYIIIGIVLIAIGTGFTIWGSQVKNRAENEMTAKAVQDKVDEAIQIMQKAQGEATEDVVKNEIAGIENRFRNWALDFIAERSVRKLRYDQAQLSSVETELSLSKESSTIINHVLESIKQLVTAYNEEANTTYIIDLPEPPKNLYEREYLGKVIFNEYNTWHIKSKARKPASNIDLPYITIGFQPDSLQEESINWIAINTRKDIISMHIFGNSIPETDVFEDIPLENFQDQLTKAIQYLFEVQIHMLGE